MTRIRIIRRCIRAKFTLFPLLISTFVLLLLRQRRGAAAATWAPRSRTRKKQRAALRASAKTHPNNSALHTGKIRSFPLHISTDVLLLLRQRRGLGNDLG
jgi:hypothetical protein